MVQQERSLGSGLSTTINPSNSDYSFTSDYKYSEKKCNSPRKTEQLHQKDNYSIASYGGNVRYSSQKR